MRGDQLKTLTIYDERYTEKAFSAYRQQHGFGDSIRLGDMPLNVVSEVLRQAQKLKEAERCQL